MTYLEMARENVQSGIILYNNGKVKDAGFFFAMCLFNLLKQALEDAHWHFDDRASFTDLCSTIMAHDIKTELPMTQIQMHSFTIAVYIRKSQTDRFFTVKHSTVSTFMDICRDCFKDYAT